MTTGRINQVNIFQKGQKLIQQFQTSTHLSHSLRIRKPNTSKRKMHASVIIIDRILISHQDKNTSDTCTPSSSSNPSQKHYSTHLSFPPINTVPQQTASENTNNRNRNNTIYSYFTLDSCHEPSIHRSVPKH